MSFRVELLDRPRTAKTIDDDGCPACQYVHEFGRGPGVYFVLVDGEVLYRTEQLDENGQVLLCQLVTEEAARKEMNP